MGGQNDNSGYKLVQVRYQSIYVTIKLTILQIQINFAKPELLERSHLQLCKPYSCLVPFSTKGKYYFKLYKQTERKNKMEVTASLKA